MTRVFGHFDVDAAIIDLDGTMVDTLGDFVVALNRMLADLPPPHRDFTVDRATVALLVGKGSEHLLSSVLRLATGAATTETDALFAAAWHSYQQHYQTINGQYATVYPGVVTGLQQLKRQGLKLACLTNKPTAFAVPLLKAKGLDGFFDLSFGGDAFARKKPDPLPLLETCAALGTVLAFMMSVIALSLPEAIILRKVLKPRLIATFFGVVALGILLVGYLFNLLM